jgi:VIT1/CCC1 family predicted Fe2+/Mn2+ transporter
LLEFASREEQNWVVLVKDKAFEKKLNWLRASVLGANDGIVSVAGLVMGVAGAGGDRSALLLAGIAATVAGAISMGSGEYISVSAQKDTEASSGRREDLITANPWTAAWSSALAFTLGALLPLIAMTGPWEQRVLATAVAVVVALTITGWWAAWAGKFPVAKSIIRNVSVSVLTMGLSYLIGMLLGVTIL